MSVYHNIYKEEYDKIKKCLDFDIKSTEFSVWFRYIESVLSMFKYKNLPKFTLPWQVEEYLTYWSSCAFFKDDKEFKIFPCYPSGELLENGQYSKYIIIAKNDKSWIKDIKDIEICYANSMRIPTITIINELAERSSLSLDAVNTATKRAIFGKLFSCKNESQMKAMTDLLDTRNNLMPFRITMNEGFSNGDINVYDYFDNSKDDVIALWDVFTRRDNFFYSTFGISNVDIQKKERLTQSEGDSNKEKTRYTLLSDMYNLRLDWIKRIKNHFGYEIEVDINRDSQNVYELKLSNDEKIEDQKIEISKGANIAKSVNIENSEEQNKNE